MEISQTPMLVCLFQGRTGREWGISSKYMRLPVALFGLCLALSLSAEPINTPTAPSTASLKALDLEQLMDLHVTSVSRAPEPYVQAPAALQLITGDEIRRY